MNTQKTILHIIDTTGPGGAETIFTQLASESNKKGFRTLVLIRGSGWVMEELKRLGIEYIVRDCKGSFNIKFLFFLIKLLWKEKVNVVQAHLLGSCVYASLAGWITRTPVISTFHGFVDFSKNERFALVKFLSIRFGSKKVVAVTEQLFQRLAEIPYLNSSRLMVIPNGVDTEKFPPVTQSVKSQQTHIGCLGNVRRAKNYPLAIKVLGELVNNKQQDCVLHIAGDDGNELAKECKQLVAELGLGSRVVWHGFINSVPEYLASLNIFLLTSSSEGHPLALTQAMAVGLPIVTTRCGVEHVVSNNSALLAENENRDDITEKILLLISDPVLCRTLAETAVVEARSKWSLNFTFDQYFTLYNLESR
jgi:glycosyltransferase involved in cell wall biosynthesis